MSRRIGRRSLLAAAGGGLSLSLAGCGYQPAGGELAWKRDRGYGGLAHSSDGTWRSDGEFLYWIRNRSGSMFTGDGWVEIEDSRVTAYGAHGEVAWSGSGERRFVGEPAVANGRVYLSLEDGRITGIAPAERDGVDDTGSPSSDDETAEWTTPVPGDGRVHLYAGDDVLICTHSGGLTAFDAETGDDRFVLDHEALGVDAIDDVVVADQRTWLVGDGELRTIDRDGSIQGKRTVPRTPNWLAATGAGAVFSAGSELVVIDRDGNRRGEVPVDGTGSATVVSSRDRLYYHGNGKLTAVDIAAGRAAWTRTFWSEPVADADGVYGLKWGPDGCELAAVTSSGEDWWQVTLLDELDCSSDLHLVGERVVIPSADRLYGFRTAPGTRHTVL